MDFQIRYSHGKGSFSYTYFKADEEPMAVALDKANEDLEKSRANAYPRSIYNPPKTASVVQYDKQLGRAVRGGLKFKLVYCYAKFTNSQKQVTAFKDWYEVMD